MRAFELTLMRVDRRKIPVHDTWALMDAAERAAELGLVSKSCYRKPGRDDGGRVRILRITPMRAVTLNHLAAAAARAAEALEQGGRYLVIHEAIVD